MDDQQLTRVEPGFIVDESGYPFFGLETPAWISRLDEHFVGKPIRIIADDGFRACANLGRRVGELDLYREWLRNALDTNNSPWWCAALASRMLGGFFSSGKSMLDAGSIALNHILKLDLKKKQQDFGKPLFWRTLRDVDLAAHDALVCHRTLVSDAVKWRDAAIHRLPPVVRVLDAPLSKAPEEITMEDVRLGTPDTPEVDAVDLLREPGKFTWLEPLELADTFGKRFHTFAADVSSVLLTRLDSSPHDFCD